MCITMLHSTSLLLVLCVLMLSQAVSASSGGACCHRKLNNGVIYTHYLTLADPSHILAEYGCQSGKITLAVCKVWLLCGVAGCLYAEEDGDPDSVFCFNSVSGSYPSQCIADCKDRALCVSLIFRKIFDRLHPASVSTSRTNNNPRIFS